MIIIDSSHAERLESALHMAGAIRDNGTVNTDFGASLYILTGLPSVYDRVQQYIHNGWLDFGPMLRMALSGGEKILVELAGNLYNGSFFIGYTPEDIVSQCDSDMVELAVTAIWLRKQKLHYSEVCGVWYDASGTKDALRSFTERKGPEIPGMAQEFPAGASIFAKTAQK